MRLFSMLYVLISFVSTSFAMNAEENEVGLFSGKVLVFRSMIKDRLNSLKKLNANQPLSGFESTFNAESIFSDEQVSQLDEVDEKHIRVMGRLMLFATRGMYFETAYIRAAKSDRPRDDLFDILAVPGAIVGYCSGIPQFYVFPLIAAVSKGARILSLKVMEADHWLEKKCFSMPSEQELDDAYDALKGISEHGKNLFDLAFGFFRPDENRTNEVRDFWKADSIHMSFLRYMQNGVLCESANCAMKKCADVYNWARGICYDAVELFP